MDSIIVNDITKTYGDLKAVDGISLNVRKGEIFGLLGPNGAGKTTLLMMLATLLKPTSGKASVGGFDIVAHPSKVRGSIGMVFQDPSSDDILTGYENLKLHALMYDVPMRDIDRRIDSVLSLVDLLDRKREIVRHYSGGMRRRLEIARGLLHQPEILFLDEPTIGLDPQTRVHIWNYIETLAKKSGMTIVVTTHYMEEAENLCNRVAIIDHGKIVAMDTPDNLRHALGGDVVILEGAERTDRFDTLPFVKKIETKDGQVKLWVENASVHLQELLSAAGHVTSVESRSPDLNDVFLQYTGREIREQEGGTEEAVRAFTRANGNH